MQQNDPDCSRVDQHDLVLGLGGNVQPDPFVSAQSAQPSYSAVQSDPPLEPVEPETHAWLLEPQLSRNRKSLRQWQHELRLLKEDQPDQFMRQSGPFFTKWCLSNQVDFRAPL